MTKPTMPEPVAHRSKESPYLFILGGPEADGFDGLITTDQAEAYADARVRDALEEAAQVASDWSIQYVEVDTAPRQVGEYIRALIPATK